MRLVASRGPRVSLEDVADEAGISRQTLYVHFGSRAGLFIAMAEYMDTSEQLQPLLQRVFAAPTALDALDAVAEVHAQYHPVAYPVARVFLAGRYDDEALRRTWDERMSSRRLLYRDVVARLHDEGLLGARWDVETATDIIWALTSWQMWEALVVERGWSKADYLRHLRTVLRRTLVVPRT